jgi:hypothetical protein
MNSNLDPLSSYISEEDINVFGPRRHSRQAGGFVNEHTISQQQDYVFTSNPLKP